MIECPETLVIAEQMNQTIKGRRIAEGNRGNSPHKFAFNNGTSEEYAAIFAGTTVGESWGHGSALLTRIEPDHTLVLGCGGQRIVFHESEKTIPKKHQLWVRFEDATYLTVTISGWGNTLLLPADEAGAHAHVQEHRISALSDAFTWDHFRGLFDGLDPASKASLKYFIISKPGVWGIGNGCLQDILFHAKLHPKRRAVETTKDERHALYTSIRKTLQQIKDLGGRDSERNLFNEPGGYQRILHSKTKGQPCPVCGTLIEKKQYLGGAIYFCPVCQK